PVVGQDAVGQDADRVAPVGLDRDALERLEVGVAGEEAHLPHGSVQDVVDLAAGCFPRHSWHEAEDTTPRRTVSTHLSQMDIRIENRKSISWIWLRRLIHQRLGMI